MPDHDVPLPRLRDVNHWTTDAPVICDATLCASHDALSLLSLIPNSASGSSDLFCSGFASHLNVLTATHNFPKIRVSLISSDVYSTHGFTSFSDILLTASYFLRITINGIYSMLFSIFFPCVSMCVRIYIVFCGIFFSDYPHGIFFPHIIHLSL